MTNLKINQLFICFAVALLFTTSCSKEEITTELQVPASIDAELTDGDYIIVFRSNALINEDISNRNFSFETRKDLMNAEAKLALQDLGIDKNSFDYVYVNALKGVSLNLTAEEANRISQSDFISFLHKTREMSTGPIMVSEGEETEEDTYASRGWQAIPWGVKKVGGAQDGTGKVAWILDTGVDTDHPDLNVDLERSISFIDGESVEDSGSGHGTHVAGTVAAIDNGEGVIGVAANATIVAVKVLSNAGSGSDAQVVAGIDYAMENFEEGDVANMSLGGNVSPILDEAVINAADAGLKMVIAAGNGNAFGIAQNCSSVSPARVNHENVYTISAINWIHGLTIFSNYSASIIDYAAPGFRVKSCYKNGTYRLLDGTSMAAPHVTGLLLMGEIAHVWKVFYDWDSNKDWIAHRGW